jgi:hypothetical protein
MSWSKEFVAEQEVAAKAEEIILEPFRQAAREHIAADLRGKGSADAEALAAIIEKQFTFVVSVYALGHPAERTIEIVEPQLLSAGSDPRAFVERIGRWNRFYLESVRTGTFESQPDSPKAAQLLERYFAGNAEEVSLAMVFLPIWLESTNAQKVAHDVMEAFITRGASEDKCLETLRCMPEPCQSVALSIWYSPAQQARRAQVKKPAGCLAVLMILLLPVLFFAGD